MSLHADSRSIKCTYQILVTNVIVSHEILENREMKHIFLVPNQLNEKIVSVNIK